jgi:hypothetical protein
VPRLFSSALLLTFDTKIIVSTSIKIARQDNAGFQLSITLKEELNEQMYESHMINASNHFKLKI